MDYKGLKRYFLRLKEPAGKRKATVFLACFVCSVLFWLLLKLSSENQAVFSMPLTVSEIPADLLLYEQSDSSLTYSVQTSGARLFASLFRKSRDTLSLPMSSLSRMDRDGTTAHFLTQNQAAARLRAGLDQGMNVQRVWPDTVFFKLTDKQSQMLPVRVRADLTYEKRFGSYGPIRVEPDTVLLEGPRFLLDTVTQIETEQLIYRELNRTVEVAARLVKPVPHPAVRILPERVLVSIPVEEFTEATLEVELELNCPDDMEETGGRLRLFPNRVQITFLVSLRDYARVDPALFSAVVDCPDPASGERLLEVQIGQIPDYVRLESIRPSSVDYLILK